MLLIPVHVVFLVLLHVIAQIIRTLCSAHNSLLDKTLSLLAQCTFAIQGTLLPTLIMAGLVNLVVIM